MSNVSSAVHSFRDAWEQRFPDVPWSDNEIFVPVSAQAPATEFTFVFTGIDEFPLIDIAWREDGPGLTEAMNVDMRPVENASGMGLRLTLEGFDSRWLHGFRLRQQDGCRVAGLGCMQRDGEAWTTIYNSRRRCEAFREFIGEWFDGRSPEEQNAVSPLLALAGQLAFGEVPQCTMLIDRSEPAKALIKANPWLPAKFGLEYITHGLKRTFRFWSARERAAALGEAVEIVQALRSITDDACIFGGATVGLRREGKLLDHDDDLDILVVVDRERYPDLGTALEKIGAVLNAAGWSTAGYFFSHLWINTRSSLLPTLDVFVGIAEGDRVSYYPLPRRGLEKARLFPREWRSLEGVDIPVPRDLDYYLESEYGPQWRVPDANFTLPWDRRPYADLAGNRSFAMLSTRGEKAFVARQNARPQVVPLPKAA